MTKARNQWSDEELQTLRHRYPHMGADKAANYLPNRTPRSVEQKAFELKLSVLPEVKRKMLSDRAKAQGNLHKGQQVEPLPAEYLQASDIFQVGFRYYQKLGWGHAKTN